MKHFALLLPILAGAACQHAPPEREKTFTFACSDATFSVRYDDDKAVVQLGATTYWLPRAVSGSGARYAAEGIEFWEHQGTATLSGTTGGPFENCPLQTG